MRLGSTSNNGEIGKAESQDENQLLKNKVKDLEAELQKNDEEIKRLREVVVFAWEHLQTFGKLINGISVAPWDLHLLDNKKKEIQEKAAQPLSTITNNVVEIDGAVSEQPCHESPLSTTPDQYIETKSKPRMFTRSATLVHDTDDEPDSKRARHN
ncbi:hypothetical protein ACOSP7_013170 [Xanthoceras sorbifolium]